MTSIDVVSLGDINIDRIVHLDAEALLKLDRDYEWFPKQGRTQPVARIPSPVKRLSPDTRSLGGKGANQAVAAARAGAATELLGAVGPDAEATGIIEAVEEPGVRTENIKRTTQPTGTAYVLVGPEGNNRILSASRANGAVDPGYVNAVRSRLSEPAVVLLQNGPSIEALRTALEVVRDVTPEPPTVILDPAPPGGAAELLAHPAVDIATPNAAEYDSLAEYWPSFTGTVIHKQGPDPVRVTTAGGGSFELTPPEVEPVDTTGAGDTLNGYLAAGLAEGRALQPALEKAVRAAALSTTREGVYNAIPTALETMQFGEVDHAGSMD